MVSATSGPMEGVAATGLGPQEGQPGRRGRPRKHYGCGVLGAVPLYLLRSPGRTLESSMLGSGPKDLSSVQGNEDLFWSSSPHSRSSGHSSPFSLSPGIPSSFAPCNPILKILFASSFHYFPHSGAPAPSMSFPRAPCPPFLCGGPSPISQYVFLGSG